MDWLTQRSVIQYIGPSSRKSADTCGYCRNSETPIVHSEDSDDDADPSENRSRCFGLGAIRVYSHEAEVLLNTGWSWSGRYLYKPEMERTCCPLYTIRLDAPKFALSRSQKRVLRIWRDYLQYDKRVATKTPFSKGKSAAYAGPRALKAPTPRRTEPRPTAGRKRKEMRKERAINRLREKGVNIDEYQRSRLEQENARQRTLEDYLCNHQDGWRHKLELRIVTEGTKEFSESFEESFNVYRKYQNHIHNDHDCTRKGFQSFLIDNPFVPREYGELYPGGPSEGGQHIQYLIDGKIVAVGVVDILPYCLSSAYFYYDPDYQFLNFGTYSALREVELTRQICRYNPHFRYYYMGYYVHNCRKMRYKAAFRPSELLCNKTHQWVSLPECLRMLDQNEGRYTTFVDGPAANRDGTLSDVQPIKYEFENFEKVEPTDELAEKLEPLVKYLGKNCNRFYVIV
ncbi:unnamed protein product [Bursaphelenchus okinawaensis]|uniref:Arginyl-tRNA--protein transferase 1 n=1 Tax=Bursaphelenchus okinawaensis TaxID=465554 RepID=A0A811JQ89_9BILA|nr:unnamed protein product [Bursaphelenchus okinawaensis]CAG9077392.1 unnamed protein product [Bursaphelenchus okinawaensis]